MGNDEHQIQNRCLPNPAAALSLFLFRLLGGPFLLLHLLDRGRVPLVFLALRIQVIEVECVDDFLLLEQELLHLAPDDCWDAACLFSILLSEYILKQVFIPSFVISVTQTPET